MPESSITENTARENAARSVRDIIAPRRGLGYAWGLMLLCILTLAVYYRVLVRLVIDWWRIPDFSHGYLVFIFAAYLVWAKRKFLLERPVEPNWGGPAVIALGLAILLLGEYGAELFLSRVSLLLVLAGLILCFGGWKILIELRFALLILLLAIPIPAIIFNQITLPLQILASKLASNLLRLSEVPVLREGNVIMLPTIRLEVAGGLQRYLIPDESSRSLFSMVTFSKHRYCGDQCSLWPVSRSRSERTPHAFSAQDCVSNTGIRRRPWAFFTSFPAGSCFSSHSDAFSLSIVPCLSFRSRG